LGDENARIEKYVEHVQYIANLVGPQYISIGMDHLYFASLFDQFMQSQTVTHPQVYVSNVKKAFSSKSLGAENIVEIIEELLKKGVSEKEVKGIIGENYLRVLREVWH
jgi:membrane dipeptidase